jgi:hypothetical protein
MTPGTYLRKRREAAQITIMDAAEKLASLPGAQGHTFAVRCDMLNRALVRIEANVDFLTPDHATLVQTAFQFDPLVYARLVTGANPAPRICAGCACTDADPCESDGCPCFWVERNLCSTCRRRAPSRQASNAYYHPTGAGL